jgi:hypothetical protein
MQHAYRLGKANRSTGKTTGEYVRKQLDRLGLCADMTFIQWGSRQISLPPSRLAPAEL